MEKEKNQLFFFLKKVTKVTVIRKCITINSSFCLDITSWQPLPITLKRNENTY